MGGRGNSSVSIAGNRNGGSVARLGSAAGHGGRVEAKLDAGLGAVGVRVCVCSGSRSTAYRTTVGDGRIGSHIGNRLIGRRMQRALLLTCSLKKG